MSRSGNIDGIQSNIQKLKEDYVEISRSIKGFQRQIIEDSKQIQKIEDDTHKLKEDVSKYKIKIEEKEKQLFHVNKIYSGLVGYSTEEFQKKFGSPEKFIERFNDTKTNIIALIKATKIVHNDKAKSLDFTKIMQHLVKQIREFVMEALLASVENKLKKGMTCLSASYESMYEVICKPTTFPIVRDIKTWYKKQTVYCSDATESLCNVTKNLVYFIAYEMTFLDSDFHRIRWKDIDSDTMFPALLQYDPDRSDKIVSDKLLFSTT